MVVATTQAFVVTKLYMLFTQKFSKNRPRLNVREAKIIAIVHSKWDDNELTVFCSPYSTVRTYSSFSNVDNATTRVV